MQLNLHCFLEHNFNVRFSLKTRCPSFDNVPIISLIGSLFHRLTDLDNASLLAHQFPPKILSVPTRRWHRSNALAVFAAAGPEKGPVVVVDNYDSFTFNLCQYLGSQGCEYIVLPNDAKTVEEIQSINPRGILVSPGPGRPEDSGISLEIIEKLGPEGFPIFGVCMGHQCIGQVFGGNVIRAPSGVMHGKASPVWHTNVGLVAGLPNPFQAGRYHSLVIDKESCPEDLEVTAWCEDGTIMAVRHKKYPKVQGVQFHPESIITENGMLIVKNFVDTLGD